MKLTDYYDALSKADWTYEYSDDHRKWQQGRAAMATLKARANYSPEHKLLFDGFHAHVFSGPAFGSEQKPIPERPDETPDCD
jgi:hypothetical protein